MSPEIRALVARQASLRAASARVHTRPRRRPKQQIRRVDALLQACDLFFPEGVAYERVPTFDALAQLPWLRPLDLWRGEGGIEGLILHLLVTVPYPMPAFLLCPEEEAPVWWRGLRPPSGLRLLTHLGQGRSAREATRIGLLPATLTRRMLHVLMNLDAPMPLLRAIRHVQLRELGAEPWLVDALLPTRLGPMGSAAEEREHLPLLRWLASRGAELPPERLRGVVDWLLAKEPAERKAALRLGAAQAVQASEAWHHASIRTSSYIAGPLPLSALKELRLRRDDGLWEVFQLRRGEHLVVEGAVLRHCVATYFQSALNGSCEIFSLCHEGQRRLTVEVRPHTRAVVQARGLLNRPPRPDERAVLERFAAVNQLAVGQV